METKALTDFITEIRYDDLDQATVSYAKMCIQDLMGVAIASDRDPTGEIWGQYFFGTTGPERQASRWGNGFEKAEYHKVAACNAASSHLLDLDDVHNSSITHPGTITIPAAIAVGQQHHRSGRDVIAAIVGGYEAAARIGEAINPGAYWYWHTTGVVGSFSSAAAAGKLIGLNKRQMLHAFGSAGTQSAGLWEFLEDGCMSKSLHTANATLCGIRAAELAALGFTGASRILEGKKGFLGALNPKANAEALTRDLITGNYKIMSNSFKPYACCRHIHSANYCMQLLKGEQTIDPERIVKMIDRTYQVAKNTADIVSPDTDYAYKFSIQYCVSAMLLYGDLMGDAFTTGKTRDSAVQRLMKKVEVVVDEELQKAYERDPNEWSHILEIHMDDGSVLTKRVDYPLGDFKNPFTWEIEDNKFRQITAGIIPPKQADQLMKNIKDLDTIEDINELFDL